MHYSSCCSCLSVDVAQITTFPGRRTVEEKAQPRPRRMSNKLSNVPYKRSVRCFLLADGN